MLNIIVVDDSKLARKRVIESIAETQIPHTVIAESSNGIEALEEYKICTPNLIITDIEMPQMNGIMFIEEMRKINPTIDILVVSSVANPSLLHILKQDRHVIFLKKPFSSQTLKPLLERILHHLS